MGGDRHREIKEQIHNFWPQLGEILGEHDEQSVKEFLHQVFEMYRQIHKTSAENFDREMAKPYRPFAHQLRPVHYEDIVRQLDGASSEILDQGILKPFPQKHIVKPYPPKPFTRPSVSGEILTPYKFNGRPQHFAPVEVEGEMEEPVSQMHILRPLHTLPTKLDEEMENSIPEKHFMRPIPALPVERPEEMEKSIPEELIMRPLEAVSGEINDQEMIKPCTGNKRPQHAPVIVEGEMEESFPQMHILLPLHATPAELDEEKSLPQKQIMRPLHATSAEFEEMEKLVPQKHFMRPLEAVLGEGEIKGQGMMKPFLYKYNKRPHYPAPVVVEGQMEEPLPQ